MPVFSPDQLAGWTSGTWTSLPSEALSGFTMDSRKACPGQVFVALRSAKRDGHDFLAAAQEAGASAALVARPQANLALPQLVVENPLKAFQTIARAWRSRFAGPVVGITGSCGKTSTKDLLALLLGGNEGGVHATLANLNNHIGVPLTLTALDPSKHRYAVIEAGISEPGEMKLLAAMIEPDVALTTCVAPAHLRDLGDLDTVAAEKARLGAAVRPAGIAIFPRQCAQFAPFRDLNVRRMVLEPAEVLLPSRPPRDVVYFTTTQRAETSAISLTWGDAPPLTFTFARRSAGMAQNAALAVCVALWLGIAPEAIQERLALWAPGRLRGELSWEGECLRYVDCYNANPASMADALENFTSLAPVAQARLYLLACMEELGPASELLHARLGAGLKLRPGDRAIVIGEQAAALRRGLLEAGASPSQLSEYSSVDGAKEEILSWRGSLFVKGSRRYALETALPLTALPGRTSSC